MATDLYRSITDQIVAELEKGVRPWSKPWDAGAMADRVIRPFRHNGIAYQGVNVLALWMRSVAQGYGSPFWMTYRQALELGGQVRRGEKSALVVHAGRITRSETDASGEEATREIPYLKGYAVFNAAQVDGLPGHFYPAPVAPPDSGIARIAHAERYFAATGAHIDHGGNQAFYAIGADRIQLPPFEAFRDAESYYATLGHECVHWTRHATRLNRDFGRKRWGDEGYAMEELVAELGAAFLCADLNLTLSIRDDHAAYLASWLKVLKQDSRAIFAAASHAQRATDFLHALQPVTEVEAAAA